LTRFPGKPRLFALFGPTFGRKYLSSANICHFSKTAENRDTENRRHGLELGTWTPTRPADKGQRHGRRRHLRARFYRPRAPRARAHTDHGHGRTSAGARMSARYTDHKRPAPVGQVKTRPAARRRHRHPIASGAIPFDGPRPAQVPDFRLSKRQTGAGAR
jgi:hypothetical protein